MANYRATASVLDKDGSTATVTFYTSAADLATATGRFQGAIEAMDTLILGKVTEVAVAVVTDISGWTLKATVGATADNEVKGRFVFGVAGGYKMRISLPSFDKDTYTNVGGAIKDSADDTDVYAFVQTAMIGGALTDSRFADITDLIAAYEAFGSR